MLELLPNIDLALIDQISFAVIGPTAVWLTQSRLEQRRKWACVLGLFGRIFWFHFAITTGSWGLLIASVAYSYDWLYGFYHHWYLPYHNGHR